ncbi:hypothetical protein K432DRAFT_409056 [Lepidopterella palustris CBS 459.81]|uniref:SET domain-containing protein n=1 Tax=Lepidopterella palustris CBS 459.81 TaxID=1314670 RepID=A0A8E2JAI0_9PEZI|nr:hypothetical protein K432DRAFT_409056 [Lepidopterella palustris CBS 459.81]
MTDISSFKTHADPQPSSVAPFGGSSSFAFTNGSPALDGAIDEEESSTIKCICGFPDDDGNTVLCESCDTWQHIVCYYESTQHVPDIHECADCNPSRHVDAKRASAQQRQRRELQNIGERKGKPKTATKSHKKKVKDSPAAVQTNGWGALANNDIHYGASRKSESPKDQPPPAKRPKTGHRTSGSVSVLSQTPPLPPGSRKRAGSAMYNGQQSPVKSPTTPGTNGYGVDEFSPEFISLYRNPEPPSIESNSYTDIGVANEISMWLNDREALADATNGMEPGQIFQRVEKSIVDLEAMAPVITKQTEEDTNITAHGLHPQWQYLTVEAPVPNGAFIGELKGHIGRKADYFLNPANRWDLLQHPEPFVFFPPHLPIYIDTRREGTILRYTRRSCNPNMTMKILTQSREGGYHFCFVATDDIQPGEELTISWEISPEIRQLLSNSVTNGDIRKEGFKKVEHFSQWVASVLANFGGCACDPCDPLKGRECLLERARRPNNSQSDSVQIHKATKSKKTKKTQISPLSTGHATNSRAGSEVFNRDTQEDDNMESRSTSGSSRSKPGSRDITPMTHFSVDGLDVKMSDREKRKLLQQERLFEQLEYDEQHGSKRRKRNSAGSTLNTPGVATSKQLGHPEPSPSSAMSHSALKNRSSDACLPRKSTSTNGNRVGGYSGRINGRSSDQSPKPRPEYVDNSTQTEEDVLTSTPMSPALNKRPYKPLVSFKRKLLLQAQEERLQRERRRSVKTEVESPVLQDVAENKPCIVLEPVEEKQTSTMVTSEAQTDSPTEPVHAQPARQEDVEMKDVDEPTAFSPKLDSSKPATLSGDPASEHHSQTSHLPIQPPPPPWPLSTFPTQTTLQQNQRPIDLHVQLPPTPDFSSHSLSTTSLVDTPGSITSAIRGGSIADSPSALHTNPALFSSSIAGSLNSGPARKKLSLSDYTSRRAKRNIEAQSVTQGQPSSSGSPPASQTVHTAQIQASSPAISGPSVSAQPGSSPVRASDTSSIPPESPPVSIIMNEEPRSHPPPPLFPAPG